MVKGEAKLRQLESLSKATHELMSRLGEMSLDQCLYVIASNAAEMLDAETCEVYLVKRPGLLSLEASHGHSARDFIKGSEVPVTDDPGAGLISRIASAGKIFNAHGKDLLAQLTEQEAGNSPVESERAHSLLVIPLKKKVGSEERLSGLLCAGNKKDANGRAHDSLGFTIEDEWMLNILAENIVVATGNVELVERLSEQKDYLGRLVGSSPNGIIAIDAHGSIMEFNKRSEEILGYTAEEVMHTSILSLYLNPQEGRRLSRGLLPTGSLEGYEIRLKAKSGEEVPLRLSATLLCDKREERIGAVGYFEDLRSLTQANRKVGLLLKASNVVAHPQSLKDGLRSLAEMITETLAHTFCRILLLDESKEFLVVRAAHAIPGKHNPLQWDPGFGQRVHLADWPDLLSTLDKGTHKILHLKDEKVRPVLNGLTAQLKLSENIQSLLLVPMKIGSKIVGMLELGELRSEERRQFTKQNVDLASAITEQAAVLIDRLNLHERTSAHEDELARLDEKAKAMSTPFELKEVLLKIVEAAQEILGADSSTIWPYDKEQNRFASQELVAVGIPPDILKDFQDLEPSFGGMTHTIMQKEWVGFPHISEIGVEYLESERFKLLKRMGVESFQGIVLKVGEDEVVGVLYVNYNRHMTFNEENRRTLKNLATHAALSLKRAWLLDQVTKAKKAAEVVALVTVLGKVDDTLSSVTEGTLAAIGCDAVTLYVYNRSTKECEHPPKMAGVKYPERLLQQKVLPGSLIYRMLHEDEPYLVEDVEDNELFKDRRFAKDEGIKSCMAVPLKVSQEPLGVMFVNYCTPHHFTANDISNISLFANQAAVAIRNAKLFEERQRRLTSLGELAKLSEEFLGTSNPKEILNHAVKKARNVLKTDCCNIVLPNKDRKLLFEAESGWVGVEVGVTEMERGKGSQTGYTIESKQAVYVRDYRSTRKGFDTPQIVLDNQLISGMSVPMKDQRNEVVGAMLVHTKKKRYFTNTEANLLALIANQTATALKSAESRERRHASSNALHQAAKAILSSFNRKLTEVLAQIVKHAVICARDLNGQKATFGTIQLYDKESDKLTFLSAYPPEKKIELINKIGEPRNIKKDNPAGISGTAVLTKTPQLVHNVKDRLDYVEFDPDTVSELAIPLLDTENQCLGVLNVESNRLAAFDSEDLTTLLALAELAVIAIQNYKQQDLINARTALVWMGMSSSQWRHAIHAHAVTIKHNIDEAFADLETPSFETLKERLLEISELAQLITDQPIAPPLSAVEGAGLVHVNKLLSERVGQLWEHRSHQQAGYKFDFTLDDQATVMATAGWLNKALDILIDNSVEAMKDTKLKVLTLRTEREGDYALIKITDTGKGVHEDIWRSLLENRVEKTEGSKGLGLGLLLARVIVQAYGGDILKGSTGPNGTSMIIKLPLV